ncbi:GyrI-like domain-containing protein [Saccharopolyspora taberi]|uniref:GyrI-like domain-containing protein n=1 Tax=Saccharopolyspora taberi TaxID=60895 RepID=A0ABN3V8G4_9PSEU
MAEPELTTTDATTTAVIRGTVRMSEIADFYDRSFQEIGRTLAAQSLAPTGPAFGLYHGIPGETAELEVGFPTGRPVEPTGDVVAGSLPSGRVARLVHEGAFDGLGTSWERLGTWIGEQGLTPGSVFWEVYLTEPGPDVDPGTLRTELNWPVG